MEILLFLVPAGILYVLILKGFEWRNLGRGIGTPRLSPPAGASLPVKILSILGKTILYVANFCLQLLIFCFKQAFKIQGGKK